VSTPADNEQIRLMLSGGPATDWIDEERGIMPPPRWAIAAPWTPADGLPVPEAVWLCRVEWGYPEWRVRDRPEPIRGRSALYWLERERDDSPKRAVDGAYVYSHVPDAEVGEYVSPEQARWTRGILHMGKSNASETDPAEPEEEEPTP
jgi:hypothetical protein